MFKSCVVRVKSSGGGNWVSLYQPGPSCTSRYDSKKLSIDYMLMNVWSVSKCVLFLKGIEGKRTVS